MRIVGNVLAVLVALVLVYGSVAAHAGNTSGSFALASPFAGLLNFSFCSISVSKPTVSAGDSFVLKWNTFNIGNVYLWHEGKGGGEERIEKRGSRTLVVGRDITVNPNDAPSTEYFRIGSNAEQARDNPICETQITINPRPASSPSQTSGGTGGSVSGTTDGPVHFFIAPASITVGGTALVTWNVDLTGEPVACYFRAGLSGIPQLVGQNGSLVVSPSASTQYRLTCSNVSDGRVRADKSARLIVTQSQHSSRASGGSGGGGFSGGGGEGVYGGGFGGSGNFGSGFGGSWGGFSGIPSVGGGGSTCLSITGCGSVSPVNWE